MSETASLLARNDPPPTYASTWFDDGSDARNAPIPPRRSRPYAYTSPGIPPDPEPTTPFTSSSPPPTSARTQRKRASSPSALRPRSMSGSTSLLIVLSFILVATTACAAAYVASSRPRDILDPVERENIRREWRRERENHESEHQQWLREREEFEQFKALRIQERLEYELEVEARVRQRGEWEKERRRHEEEDQRWEKEKWERMQLYWGELWRNGKCHSYATREYTARLWNIAPGANGIEACMQKTMTINNRVILPTECEDRGRDGIHGRWLVNFEETSCQPYWGTMYDKGCVSGGPGLHRVEARLENIQSGDNWQNMCDTTPNVVNGIEFATPTSCENRGWWNGMVGIWEYPDAGCA